MITLSEYFGRWMNHPDATLERKANAVILLSHCALLQMLAEEDGIIFRENPLTESGISGDIYGGFRPQDCPQGAPKSSHKTGEGVDRYDPKDEIDAWCLANLDKLAECGLYIEAPVSTPRWSHWTTRRPDSGHRVFLP